MKLVSMEYEKSEVKSMDVACSPEQSKYPYGLCISISTESLEKLGIKELPEVGTVMMLNAKCVVQSTHESQNLDGHENKNLGLQITDMNLKEGNQKSSEEVIYGDKK